MEKGVPLVFAQRGVCKNNEVCSLMSSVLQRNVFVDRSARFLDACHASFETTLRALTTWKYEQRLPKILLIRSDNEFHTQLAAQIREMFSKVNGTFLDLPLNLDPSSSSVTQVSEVLQAFQHQTLYVVVLQLNPEVWLSPIEAASHIAGMVVLFPPVHTMASIAVALDSAAARSTMFMTNFSRDTVRRATAVSQLTPNVICVLLPDLDHNAKPRFSAYLTRAILLFVMSHHNVTSPTSRLMPRL